jgi:hypothetical protein
MHNCNDKNIVRIDCIKNPIGKPAHRTTADISIYCSIAIRKFPNSIDSIFDSINKRLCYLSSLFYIVLDGLSIFSERLRVKHILLVLHSFAWNGFTSISAIHRTGDEQVFQPMVVVLEAIKILKR